MNNWVVILYMVTILVKGLGQSSTHDLPWESTGNYIYYRSQYSNQKLLKVLYGIYYIYYPWEFKVLIYQVQTWFLQDIYSYNDSTGPISIAQFQSHQFPQDHEKLFLREHMYSCVNLSTIFPNDPLKSLFILIVSSFLNQLIIFPKPSYLSLLVYQTLDFNCRNTILG